MTAPTTAKVRALVQSAWADAQSDGPYCDNVYAQGSHGGRAEALESIALPLAIERDGLAAQVATIVRELGGEVEGLPTQTINYLQRIRALRRVEAERDALAAEVARLREGNSPARAYAAACQARFPELATDLCVLAAKGPR